MKKIVVLIGLMMALMVSSVIGVTVKCDEGRWNSNICRDFELQDEFDAVEDYADSIGVQAKVYSDFNTMRAMRISEQGDTDGEAYSDRNDRRVLAISNEYANTHDASGTSFRRVESFVYGEFVDFLRTIFAGKEDTTLSLEYLQAQINLGKGYSEKEYRIEAIRLKADRTGVVQKLHNHTCVPSVGFCASFH